MFRADKLLAKEDAAEDNPGAAVPTTPTSNPKRRRRRDAKPRSRLTTFNLN
jgi:hypothetical protein